MALSPLNPCSLGTGEMTQWLKYFLCKYDAEVQSLEPIWRWEKRTSFTELSPDLHIHAEVSTPTYTTWTHQNLVHMHKLINKKNNFLKNHRNKQTSLNNSFTCQWFQFTIKRQGLVEWINNQISNICRLQETHLSVQDKFWQSQNGSKCIMQTDAKTKKVQLFWCLIKKIWKQILKAKNLLLW